MMIPVNYNLLILKKTSTQITDIWTHLLYTNTKII